MFFYLVVRLQSQWVVTLFTLRQRFIILDQQQTSFHQYGYEPVFAGIKTYRKF